MSGSDPASAAGGAFDAFGLFFQVDGGALELGNKLPVCGFTGMVAHDLRQIAHFNRLFCNRSNHEDSTCACTTPFRHVCCDVTDSCPRMRQRMARFFLALGIFCALASQPACASGVADAAAVARIHGGIVDCVGCQLMGADLANTCVKAHDLHGADFDGADATLMCMSFANFTGASFRGTNLSAANLAHAKLDGADLTGANLEVTSFKGTDLTHVKGLTQAQLDKACTDDETKLPAGLKPHPCR